MAGRKGSFPDPDGRPEGPAGQRAPGVEIATAGLWIESGAGEGAVAGKVGIGGLVVVREDSGLRIAGKALAKERDLSARPRSDRPRPLRLLDRKLG
jgi:hypothetical protein